MYQIKEKPFIQEINTTIAHENNVRLFVLRLDIIHPIISGNKWYKLKYNLETAKQSGYEKILSFGGAFSNHIHALAAASSEAGLKSIGIIRGERPFPLNPTLDFAIKQGMDLHFVSRTDYRDKTSADFIRNLEKRYGPFYLVPEGGSNHLALKGISEIVNKKVKGYDYLCLPVGTGGTIGGIIAGMDGEGKIYGFLVLKGDFLKKAIQELISSYNNNSYSNWSLMSDYHFGGYAKFNSQLINFINQFKSDFGIPLDPIYTGKMMFGVFDLLEKGCFKKGSKILTIHTGGLQGIEGFNERFGKLIE